MRIIPVDTQTLTFIHFGLVEAAQSQDGVQRSNLEGQLLWKVPVVVLVPLAKTPEGSVVTVPGPTPPKLEQGGVVRFIGLRARVWTMNSSSGLSLSADGVEPVRPKAS
jgi:hypothetical protein